MKYQELTETYWENITHTFIQIEHEDGSFESFPADENHPRFIQFLAEQEGSK